MYAVTGGKETMQRISSNFGQIAIGGDFRLRDQTGMEVTLADFKGKWVLVYFGFCRCPDICPEQLERLVEVQERLALYGKDKDFVPIFITVDPERDTPEVVGEYVKEFSSKLVGLTGSPEQIQVTAKRYRIYYSKGPPDCDGDYIVDHTVVMYLLNPKGEFVEFYGQVKPVQEIVRRIMDHMKRRGDDRHRENYHPNNIEHENAGDGTADDGNSDEDGHDGEVDDEEEEKRRGGCVSFQD
ncbi:hypothetical protein TcWFU_001931 [Taenia crassiceps]|uniref:Thioredoxin domain-containing protein n=1 Tax=Taenia crassiceps TaxID=6207 RepID=A0ABR4QGG1_9CEST